MDIQVIVPIYNAFDVTCQALEALREHNHNDAVLLINDASTDPRMADLFQSLPPRWDVLNNSENLGFVRTANRGLKHSSGHSVLLNSDTLVTPNWLHRMQDTLDRVGDLGTATPWSNNAEICSIPTTLSHNDIPQDLAQLAQRLHKLHQPTFPELPTAVGFCMLITAEAKQQVGYFDEGTFGLGYGEENDYSLRVSQAGLRNVLVDHCYVAHVGNQSFGERNLRPNEQTMQRLLNKHPEYRSLVEKFIENDPLRQLRESIVDKIAAF